MEDGMGEMEQDVGRVPDGTGLSQAEPEDGLGPSGFDPSRVRVRTSRDLIRGIAARWWGQHRLDLDSAAPWKRGWTKRQIADALAALDPEKATVAEVDAVLGRKGWVVEDCDLCGHTQEQWFEIGEEPDYEARYIEVCAPCISALNAIAMEARQGGDACGSVACDDSAGLQGIAQTTAPS